MESQSSFNLSIKQYTLVHLLRPSLINAEAFVHSLWAVTALTTSWLSVLPADWLPALFPSQVQKMWNWRIPADFHIKPSVRFLRYRFQCTTDQSAESQSSDPAH